MSARPRIAKDSRREPRRAANGTVTVHFRSHHDVMLQGQLVDVSDSGFRMAHQSSELTTGQVVDFAHAGGSGSARVMWNRIVEGRVESGFLVVAAVN